MTERLALATHTEKRKNAAIRAAAIVLIALLSAPAFALDFTPDYTSDGLGLVHTCTNEESSRRPFYDCFCPVFKEGPLLVRARDPRRFAWYSRGQKDSRSVPTSVDGMDRIPHWGKADLNPGQFLQYWPTHKSFWVAWSARGWFLAKLKRFGLLHRPSASNTRSCNAKHKCQ